jgi:hypothetical protein
MTTMLAEVVVQMVEQFCVQARGAVSDIGEKCIRPQDGAATEALVHDINVAGVMVCDETFLIVKYCMTLLGSLSCDLPKTLFFTECSCKISSKCS